MPRKFEYTKEADKNIPLPKRGTSGSAGYDFYAPCEIHVPARGHTKLIPFNVKCCMPKSEHLQITIRSSLAVKHGLQVAQGTAIIDADYYNNVNNEGNIGIMFVNNWDEPCVIEKGQACVQGIFLPYDVTDDDNVTTVRIGGYGSTSKEAENK